MQNNASSGIQMTDEMRLLKQKHLHCPLESVLPYGYVLLFIIKERVIYSIQHLEKFSRERTTGFALAVARQVYLPDTHLFKRH